MLMTNIKTLTFVVVAVVRHEHEKDAAGSVLLQDEKKTKLRRNHLETTHGVSHCIRLTSSGEYFIKVYQRLLEGGESKKKKKLRTEAPEETRPVEKCDQTSKSRHIPGRRQENCGGKYQHHNGKVKMLERHFSFRGWSLVCLCV